MIYALITIFLLYPAIVYSKWGILSSVSASSYKLRGNQKAWFAGWLISIGIGAYWLDMGLFSHLMALGFAITGMSPDHKNNPKSAEDEYHTSGTILAIASALIGLWVVYGFWMPTIAFAAGGGLIYIVSKNWIWWVEIYAGICVFTGYLMK